MMKAVLMAGVAMMSAPLLAQETATAPQAAANTGAATVTTPQAQKGMSAQSPAATAATEPMDAPSESAAQASAATDRAVNAPAEAPAQSAEATAPAATTPAAPPQSAQSTAPAQPATAAPAQSASAQPATAQPATTGDQVAQIVDSEFPSYDKSGKGALTQEEFGTWMVALRSASDPSANAASAEMKTWVAQAFTSADADKNGSVSKDELTSFLSQGKS